MCRPSTPETEPHRVEARREEPTCSLPFLVVCPLHANVTRLPPVSIDQGSPAGCPPAGLAQTPPDPVGFRTPTADRSPHGGQTALGAKHVQSRTGRADRREWPLSLCNVCVELQNQRITMRYRNHIAPPPDGNRGQASLWNSYEGKSQIRKFPARPKT